MNSSLGILELDNAAATTVELVEVVAAPRLLLGVVVGEGLDGTLGVVALDDGTLVTVADVVVERILEGKGEELVGSFDLEDDGTNDGIVLGPAEGDNTSSVEQSGPDDLLGEVLLKTALLHVPADDLNVLVPHAVFNLDYMQTVVVVVVTLQSIPLVVVEAHVIVPSEVVAWVDPRGSGDQHQTRYY
jgi:hypothetical protein